MFSINHALKNGFKNILIKYQATDHGFEGIKCDLESTELLTVGGKKITTHSSITARAFFEQRGYRVIQEQTVIRNGISLTNYSMEKARR